MTAISDYLENALVNHVLRNTALTSPVTVYAGLWTSSSSLAALEAGTLTNEATGGSYVRKAITFSAPSNGTTSNSGAITWTNMPATTITYVAVMDALTVGNVLFYGALASAKTLNSGDTFQFDATTLSIQLT